MGLRVLNIRPDAPVKPARIDRTLTDREELEFYLRRAEEWQRENRKDGVRKSPASTRRCTG